MIVEAAVEAVEALAEAGVAAVVVIVEAAAVT